MFREEFLTRQKDLIPAEVLNKKITIIGAGAIGSFTALALAKMGFHNLTVIDDDEVDTENMNCQFFRFSDIGSAKVTALQSLIKDFVGVEIAAEQRRIGPTDVFGGDFVICAVDNMETRKNLFETVNSEYLIDPRMAAEMATLSVVPMFDKKKAESYAKTLFTDDEAVRERCTAKSTMYTVLLLSGQIAKAVKDISTGNSYVKGFDWFIDKNRLVSFSSEGEKL